MSTEARDKAAKEYGLTVTDVQVNTERRRRYVAQLDFKSGWDARGEVEADPSLLREIAVLLATKQYTGTPWRDEDVWQESLTDDEREDHLATATAILALFNEKGNE